MRFMFAVIMTVALFAGPVQAAQYTIPNDIVAGSSGLSSYTGASGNSYVSDGGYDAFDGYGQMYDFGDLGLNRQIETLADQNIYRFLDTFTNSTDSRIEQTVRFAGNLGSDSWTAFAAVDDYHSVSYQSYYSSYDPVVALVNGNNAWAADNMNKTYSGDQLNEYITLALDPGESLSLLHLVFLAMEEPRDVANRTADIALAEARSLELIASPYVSGLSSSQIAGIVNFDIGYTPGPTSVPEPSTFILLGVGLVGLLGVARRKIRD